MNKKKNNQNFYIGCRVMLKSNNFSCGTIIGKSQRGKGFYKVEWDDGSGITNIFGEHIEICN